MTIKDLKLIIADMPDDGRVFARDRDCISLDQVHVVGHKNKANAMADVKATHKIFYHLVREKVFELNSV